MEKRWSKAEIAHLERHAAETSLEELAQKFHTDADTVRRKIEELGVGSSPVPRSVEDDPGLAHYTAGITLLHEKEWEAAAAKFEAALTTSDTRQISDRARQNLEICRRSLSAGDDGGDSYLRAVYEKNRGNLEAALEICRARGRETEEDERWAYLAASLQALTDAPEEALRLLETSIRLEPKNRVHAYNDPDFSEIRGQESFTELIAATANTADTATS